MMKVEILKSELNIPKLLRTKWNDNSFKDVFSITYFKGTRHSNSFMPWSFLIDT